MNTLTAPLTTARPALSATLRSAAARMLGLLPQRAGAGVPASAADLLARADAYESTQPGYAADLRAAAQRMIAQVARA